MHVIARPIHHHRLAFHAADGSCEIRKEFRPDFAAEIRLPLLGAEDRVNEAVTALHHSYHEYRAHHKLPPRLSGVCLSTLTGEGQARGTTRGLRNCDKLLIRFSR